MSRRGCHLQRITSTRSGDANGTTRGVYPTRRDGGSHQQRPYWLTCYLHPAAPPAGGYGSHHRSHLRWAIYPRYGALSERDTSTMSMNTVLPQRLTSQARSSPRSGSAGKLIGRSMATSRCDWWVWPEVTLRLTAEHANLARVGSLKIWLQRAIWMSTAPRLAAIPKRSSSGGINRERH